MSTSDVTNLCEARSFCRASRSKNSSIIGSIFLLCWINLPVIRVAEAVELTQVVNTTVGPIRGEILATIVRSLKYSSFRSIRYAEAPIGYLRFKPPVPAKPWTNVFNATIEAPECAQDDLITRDYGGSEDCLFLNVFTPTTVFDENNGKGKAVMVWIYGGAYLYGNAKTSLYGADFLLEDDVILVTLNYRLGPLGFFSLNHPNATGNAGMKDQVLALKWVNENIEKFGGDANRITIFGNSAGGSSVDLHTLSESSKGLFHGVISISGSVFNPWAIHTLNETIAQSLVVAHAVTGAAATASDEELLQSLYDATAFDIMHGASRHSKDTTPYRPTIEDPNVAGSDAFLTEAPLNKYKTGNFTKVPYITGFNAQETACMVSGDRFQPIVDAENSMIAGLRDINKSLPLTSPVLANIFSTAEDAIGAFPTVLQQELIAASSFEYFSAGIDVKQRFLTDQSADPVYYYQVSFNPPKTFNKLLRHRMDCPGTAHMDELPYMFYMPIIDMPLEETDPISITRRRVVRLWTNFAKYGNPTPNQEVDPLLNITWPASGSSGTHLEIGEELSVGPRPVDALMIYQRLLERKPVASKFSSFI